jgi:hypothetical protein
VKRIAVILVLGGCAAMEQQRDLDLLVSEAKRARAAGDRATWAEALRRAIVQRREYRAGDERKFREPLDAELRVFGDDLIKRVVERARAPLFAEELRAEHKTLLEEDAPLAAALERLIAAARRDSCQRVREQSAGKPYLTLLASRYCTRLGFPFAAPATAELRGTLALDTDIAGLERPDRDWLHDRFAEWFAKSAWHAPDAKRPAVAWLRGSSGADFETQAQEIDAPWIEQVPYQVQETYQESYTVYESQSQLVTTYDTYTYQCGNMTCTGSRPSSHTEMRSVPVTRYRTATRTVTRYRPEPRVFHYRADRTSGSYQTQLRIRVELTDKEPPLLIDHKRTGKQSGLRHDVSFPQAGVKPSEPGIFSASGWLRDQAAELERRFVGDLDERWRAKFCAAARFEAEQAARCVRAGGDQPASAIDALRAIYGDDAARITAPSDTPGR